jgi:hypothetical protein
LGSGDWKDRGLRTAQGKSYWDSHLNKQARHGWYMPGISAAGKA